MKLPALLSCSLAASLALAGDDRPNVVLILADDLGQECLGSYGGTSYRTPNIDRLAAEGVRFTRCFSMPLCTPSRVQLMTGLYNHRNYTRFGELDPGQRTFGNVLAEAGYSTGICGKWQLGGGSKELAAFGFPTWNLWQVEGRKGEPYWQPQLFADGKAIPTTAQDYGPALQQRWALDFISRHKTRPFFLYYPILLPHDPFTTTPPDTVRSNADEPANFPGMMAYLDRLVGELTDHLQRERLSERTLVIFTGDNGTNSRITSQCNGKAVRGGKWQPTPRGTHVPLIVSWPGKARPAVRDDLVDFTDFMPTFAAVAQAKRPDPCDGHSLLPAITGQGATGRTWVYSYYLKGPGDQSNTQWAHDGRWWLDATRGIFDLTADPGLKKPASGGEAEAARARLGKVIADMGAPPFPSGPGERKAKGDGKR